MGDPRTHRFTNNASCRLAEDLTAGETSIQLESGKGALFPDPDPGQIFILVIEHLLTGAREVMFCTERVNDVLEVERGQEGTSAVEWINDNNVIVQHRITAGTLEHLADHTGGLIEDLEDVEISSPQAGDTLVWDGYAWVNQASTSNIPINSQTGTEYTLDTSDVGSCIEMSNGSANEVEVPPNADEPIAIGSTILVRQMGVGQTSIVAGAGVTLRTPSGLDLRARYSLVSLHKRGTNEWCVEGGLA